MILVNIRNTEQSPNLNYDSTDDAQIISIFEFGNGKEWLKTELAGKLIPRVNDLDTQRSTQASPGWDVS